MDDGSRCGVCGQPCHLAHETAERCRSCAMVAELQPEMCRVVPWGIIDWREPLGYPCGWYITVGTRMFAMVSPFCRVDEFGVEPQWLPSWLVSEVIARLTGQMNVQPLPYRDGECRSIGAESLAELIATRPPHPWQGEPAESGWMMTVRERE